MLNLMRMGQAKIIPHRTKLVQQGEQYEVSLRLSNVGNSEASNVRIVLELNDDGFDIVGSNERYLETVSPQLYYPVQFTIVVGPQVKTLRLSFIIIYDDSSWPNRKIIFSESVKSHLPFREIPNPYNSGEPIREVKKFFDRTASLQFLRETFLTVDTKIVLLCGHRRSGKTSLIHRAIHELQATDGYIPVFLDIRELPIEDRGPGMLATLATDILNRLEPYRLTVSLFQRDDFQTDPVRTFEGFLRQLVAELPSSKLVLFIDEFDCLEEFILDQTISMNFVKTLIALMKQIDGASFLLAGEAQMHRTAESVWSMLDEKVKVHHLSQLEAHGASELITAPVNGYLNYHERVIRFIQSLTDNQPYLIQLLCETLIPICNKRHINYVDSMLVASAIEAILDRGAIHFMWVWNRLQTEERQVLSALAWEQKAEEQSVSMNDIMLLYQHNGSLLRREPLRQILVRLEEQNYILMVNTAPDRWKIAAGLMREWLQRTKPFKKIMRQR